MNSRNILYRPEQAKRHLISFQVNFKSIALFDASFCDRCLSHDYEVGKILYKTNQAKSGKSRFCRWECLSEIMYWLEQ